MVKTRNKAIERYREMRERERERLCRRRDLFAFGQAKRIVAAALGKLKIKGKNTTLADTRNDG